MITKIIGYLFALGVTCTGQIARDESLYKADQAFVRAISNADRPALDHMLDAEFTWTNFEGQSKTRSEVLSHPPRPAIPNERDAQLKQYVYGEMGDVQANLGRVHVLRVWVRRAAGWKAIVYQEVMSLTAVPSVTPRRRQRLREPLQIHSLLSRG